MNDGPKRTGEFLRRRLSRVFVPFAAWACIYGWWNGGAWDAGAEWGKMLFNFPSATGGHLWFVPMLLGLYLLMPLLSPWAERAGRSEVRGWLLVWLFTTTFPFLRRLWGALYGAPDFGAVPYLYGECPWNGFGAFHYVSGFFGYLLLGFYFRRFVAELSWRRTLALALPLWCAGFAVVWSFFYFRIPGGGAYPVADGYARAVDLETSWEFCGLGVAMTAAACFLVLRKFVQPLYQQPRCGIRTSFASPISARLRTGGPISSWTASRAVRLPNASQPASRQPQPPCAPGMQNCAAPSHSATGTASSTGISSPRTSLLTATDGSSCPTSESPA